MTDKGKGIDKGKGKRRRSLEDTPQSGGNGGSYQSSKRVQASGAHQDYPPQNPRMGQYPSPVSAVHQTPGSHQLYPPAQVAAPFGGLSLTTPSPHGAGSSFNQPPTASQPEAAGPISEYYTRPLFPDPMSNPWGSLGRPCTGYEDPEREPEYTMAEGWWVRMSVANNHHPAAVAVTLGRSEASVRNFINGLNLRWTDPQDNVLRAWNAGIRFDILEVRRRLGANDPGNYRIDDEIRDRAVTLVLHDNDQGAGGFQQNPQPYHSGSSDYPGANVPSSQSGTVSQSLEGPSSLSGQDYGVPQTVAHPMQGPNYPGPGPSSFRAGPASQSLTGPSSRLAQYHGGPETAVGPILRDEFGDHEQSGDEPSHQEQRGGDLGGQEQAGVQFLHERQKEGGRRGVPWTDQESHDIIVKRAGGLGFKDICEQFHPWRTPQAVRQHLKSRGWRDWETDEDSQLKGLHRDLGDNWERIRDSLPRRLRMPDEIKARMEFLTRNQNGQERQNGQRPRHRFTEPDDEYIVESRARGIKAAQMVSDRFPGMDASSLNRRSKNIGAMWSQEDDRLLRYMVEEGMRLGELDWDSIAETYEKPRNASGIIKLRWEYLQSRRRKGVWTWGGD